MSTKPFLRKIIIGNDEFTVDANIPVPPIHSTTRRRAELIHKMAHGDSMQFINYSAAYSFRQIVEKCGYKAETRKMGAKVWRVWVLKPEELK